MKIYRQPQSPEVPGFEIRPDQIKEVDDVLGAELLIKYPFLINLDLPEYSPDYYENTGSSPEVERRDGSIVINVPSDPVKRVDDHDKAVAEIELLERQKYQVVQHGGKVFLQDGERLYLAHDDGDLMSEVVLMNGEWYQVISSVREAPKVIKLLKYPTLWERIKRLFI